MQQFRATLWYCGAILDKITNNFVSAFVPQVECVDPKIIQACESAYKTNKENRKNFPNLQVSFYNFHCKY